MSRMASQKQEILSATQTPGQTVVFEVSSSESSSSSPPLRFLLLPLFPQTHPFVVETPMALEASRAQDREWSSLCWEEKNLHFSPHSSACCCWGIAPPRAQCRT